MPASASRWNKRSWTSPGNAGYAKNNSRYDESGYQESKCADVVPTAEPELPALLSNLGIGTWSWGDEKWGYGRQDAGYDDDTMVAAFNKARSMGVTLFDTSEVYGASHAETVLGKCLAQTDQPCFLASKWHPRSNASVFQRYRNDTIIESMRRTLKGSLNRLGLKQLDLFQLHSGSQCYGSLEDYADGLAAMVQEGLCVRVGVSNVGAKQVRRIHQRLSRSHGLGVFSNQIEFSLLEPGIMFDGTLDECKRLGVRILAYCPLAMGRLTGKYSSTNEPTFYGYGNKSYRYHGAVPWPIIDKVLVICKEIAERRKCSVTQVALNWCISHGTIPIPGAKTAEQAEDNCRTLDWKLDSDELKRLDEVASEVYASQ